MRRLRDKIWEPRRQKLRALQAIQAVRRADPWWVAIGTGNAAGWTQDGQRIAWQSKKEWELWQRWRTGGGRLADVDRTQQLLRYRPAWLRNVTQPFYDAVRAGIGPTQWDDASRNRAGSLLRWVATTPWDVKVGRWRIAKEYGTAPLPGFMPWAAIPALGVPQTFGAWYQAGGDANFEITTLPWWILALDQCLVLQAVGAGHFEGLS